MGCSFACANIYRGYRNLSEEDCWSRCISCFRRVCCCRDGIPRTGAQNIEDEEAPPSETLKILVAGQVGIGKTALVSKLLGLKPNKVTTQQDRVTNTVIIKEEVKNGVKVVTFDTPGLNDPDKEDEDIISEIVNATNGQVDLVFYCISMTRGRVSNADINGMKKLTAAFPEAGNSRSIWQNAVFVLTFANEVEPTQFAEFLREYQDRLHGFLEEKVMVPSEIACSVPVLPAGFTRPSLPDRGDWLSPLWKATLERTGTAAKHAFRSVTADHAGLSG